LYDFLDVFFTGNGIANKNILIKLGSPCEKISRISKVDVII
jgi:hypothetical protein